MPEITVITPCYNAELYIGETIDSVRAQGFSDWEYIVIDDGSTDGSCKVVEDRMRTDPRICLHVQPNSGVSRARNEGYARASANAKYLVFLDADDLLMPEFLDTMHAYMEQNCDVGLAYGSLINIDENGDPLPEYSGHEPRYVRKGRRIHELKASEPLTPLEALISRFNAIPSSCMFRRSVFEKTHGWRKIGVVEDKDMGIQMALEAPVHFVDEYLTAYRRHETQRHLEAFYASLHELHRQWWTSPDISRSQLNEVQEALIFNRRLAAHLSLDRAGQLVHQRLARQATAQTIQAGKHYASYLRLRCRKAFDRTT